MFAYEFNNQCARKRPIAQKLMLDLWVKSEQIPAVGVSVALRESAGV
jgi:hypothetical protein